MNERTLLAEHVAEGSHSPGPWVSFYKDKYDEWHVGVPLSSGSMKLALFPDGCPTDNPEADCRLIAAAPDLLALAKKYASECAGCDGEGTWVRVTNIAGPAIKLPCEDCADIRKVIDKAEGKS
jgi:hypothetical protein